MNLKTFSITPKEGQVLNWSLGLFVVFSVFNLIDGWTSAPNAGQGVLTNAFATVQSNSFIRAVEYFVIAVTKLAMLEVFRRCLNKNGDKAAQLIVTIMMVLIFCFSSCRCFNHSSFLLKRRKLRQCFMVDYHHILQLSRK